MGGSFLVGAACIEGLWVPWEHKSHDWNYQPDICIYVYIYICIYAYMQIYVQYTYIYIRIHICVYIIIYVLWHCLGKQNAVLSSVFDFSPLVLRHRGVPTARSQHYSMVWWLMSTPCGHKEASTASLQHHGEPLTIAPLMNLIQCMWPLWSVWQAGSIEVPMSQRHQDCEYKSHQPPAWWLSHTWNHDLGMGQNPGT